MPKTITRTFAGQTFEIEALNYWAAQPHAGRAKSHFAAVGAAAFSEIDQGAVMRIALERMTAEEVVFFRDLTFPLIHLVTDGKRVPLKLAAEGGLITGGMPTLEALWWVALDHSFGPFGRIGEVFAGLLPELTPSSEPSPSSG